MTTRVAGDYIEDILNALLDIQEFIAEYSYDRFVNDRKTQICRDQSYRNHRRGV